MKNRKKTAANRVSPAQAASLHLMRQELKATLRALRAIRGGEVEALGVAGSHGERFFTPKGAEHAYRVMVEAMNDGAVTLTDEGIILYANRSFAELVGAPLERVIGACIEDFAVAMDAQKLKTLLALGLHMSRREEILLKGADGLPAPALFSVHPLHTDGEDELATLCAVVTDLGDVIASREARLRLAVIVESSDDAILTITRDGVIASWNSSAERLYGYAAAEAIGHPLSLLIPPERAHELPEIVGRVGRRESMRHFETVRMRKDGRRVEVSLTVSPIEGVDESGIGASIIARDTTERKRIDGMKSEFVSTVSHELRTPLTSILGSLGLLSGGVAGELPEVAKNLIGIAKNNCERLIRLINDILDSEKIESGKIFFDLKVCELAPVLARALTANEESAAQNKVRLVLHAPPEPLRANIDSDRLNQVFSNLLSNAIKFSPADASVDISLRHIKGRIRVEISDCGPGISEDFRKRIFHKFSQADSSDTRPKGGTGLGLSISKAIIERMGGSIGFSTEVGIGTTFFVELPEWPGTCGADGAQRAF